MLTTEGAILGEIQSLTPQELITFIQIDLQTAQGLTTFRLTDSVTQTWKSHVWTNSAYDLSGVGKTSSGEFSRPKLNLPNPNGSFTYYANRNLLEGALVTRHRAHPNDLASGLGLRNRWYVSQVKSLTNQVITLELRGLSDGNRFKIPSRRFTQPEFPFVSL